MPRCANGTRKNKKTGNCEPTATKLKRCTKGTRRSKKTGNCESPVKTPSPVKMPSPLKMPSPVKTPSPSPLDTTWRIYKIDYLFPTKAIGDNENYSSHYGIMNIESVFFENERGDVAQLIFEDKEIILGKKGDDFDSNIGWDIKWENVGIKLNKANKQKSVFKNLIAAGLNSDVSQIKFLGAENDEGNNHSTEDNISKIESGYHGKYIKINAPGLDLENLRINGKIQKLFLMYI
jgi:hypothetical protein